ncbi:MAG: hypothetical protein ACRD02_03870 [Acidimicrobiia bacterium]
MGLTSFTAGATTCGVDPGEEKVSEDGLLLVRNRVFTDIVESSESQVAGTNRVTVSLDLDPEAGTGAVKGTFTLTPKGLEGTWEGELVGSLNGMISATGLGRGTGDLLGRVIYVSFQQVAEHPTGQPACEDSLAFYEMAGLVLQPA